MNLERYRYLKSQKYFAPYEDIEEKIGKSGKTFTFPKGYPYEIKSVGEAAGGAFYLRLGIGSVMLTECGDGGGWFRDSITIIEEVGVLKVAAEYLEKKNQALEEKAIEKDYGKVKLKNTMKEHCRDIKVEALEILLNVDTQQAEKVYSMLKNKEENSFGDALKIFGGDSDNFRKISNFIKENHCDS